MIRTSLKTILVVDDDVTLVLALRKRLLSAGYEVVTACNGAGAITLYEEGHVDCVLLDISMPGEIDGFGVAKCLRTDHRAQNTPIIFVTGSADEHLKQKCQELGVVYFLAKPYDADLLLRVLDGVFSKDELGELQLLSRAKRRQVIHT